MRTLTIRNVPEEVYRAIRVRAAQNGRTLQAEMCDIFTTAVKPEGRVKLGDLLASFGREVKLTDEEMAVFDPYHSPARTASFE
ncbi:FitA-like ribbon-helix-helix domain-containing protein [Allopusillimonas ginsengisoli]|uniref:FitA-like ribbon-helix-helix domain-containing protein n=1 Tax=Allopusillimonas ginsengisoli TaxID=453575 RepID=UPI0010228269|nr:Arc family DNA-binding protein [Allopusillimonas ginsengisoli]TEA77754.1 Arc family DNA-binding protein [Allopusillimonas ginsengisoli]